MKEGMDPQNSGFDCFWKSNNICCVAGNGPGEQELSNINVFEKRTLQHSASHRKVLAEKCNVSFHWHLSFHWLSFLPHIFINLANKN